MPNVKRLLVLFLGVVGGVLIAHHVRKRRDSDAVEFAPKDGSAGTASGDADVDARAEDLRRRLDEARAAPGDGGQSDASGKAAEIVAEEDPPADEFEAMRRRVHAEARDAAHKMRS